MVFAVNSLWYSMLTTIVKSIEHLQDLAICYFSKSEYYKTININS